ncbi:MAG: SemiSWEET transporter [Cyclobacteriaceae bacterium]|nr:SemiSWEET transporter [Cyclobacteriaceae bacterium]
MEPTKILGLLAGTLTTIAFIPQVIKTYQSRSAKDLSLVMFLIFFTGTGLWLTYGLLRNDVPVIAANSVTMVLAALMLVLKFRYRD